ncbi:MAG: PLxRFG domain-containing protein [Acidovorax sp.]|uniref:PLxRFG domain-containing protein n=1 Tax=Acidovorax sp. TaxID=1872122 RepID=UPI003918D8D4
MSEVDKFLDSYDKKANQAAAPASAVDDLMKTAPAQDKGMGGLLRDAGLSLAKGVVAVPEAVVGLADIATGGRVGKALENEGGAVGFRPKQAKEFLGDLHTEKYKDQQQQFQEADGILEKTGVALSNPSMIANAVVESVPVMGMGGAMGRAGLAAGRGMGAFANPTTAAQAARQAAVAGAAGEGVSMAGSQAEAIRQETADGLLTPTQSGAAALTGLVGGAVGAGSARLARYLGIGDADTMLAQGTSGMAKQFADDAATAAANAGAKPTIKSIPRKMIEGAITEGFLEELPQSMAETVLQNLALGKPWHEKLDEAAVMGVLTGGAMGAGAAGFHGLKEPTAAPGAGVAAVAGAPAEPAPDNSMTAVREQWLARAQQLREAETGEALPPQTPAPDGAALLAAQRAQQEQARLAEQAQNRAIETADDEIHQSTGFADRAPVQRPSEAMGLDPNAGSMSAAAALAVDSGATDQLAQMAQAQAQAELDAKGGKKSADKGALESAATLAAPTVDADGVIADAGPAVYPTYEDAQAYAMNQRRNGATVTGLPVPAEGGGFTLAMKGTPQYQLGEALRAERMQAERQAKASTNQQEKAPLAQDTQALPATNIVAPSANLKSITAKQIPAMTDVELQQAIEHYGPEHKRTAKLQKEVQRRAAETPTPTTGAFDGPQADQTQQASAQPTQAAAAPDAAAGLTDGTTTPQNLGAQAAPAGGTQGNAQTPDQIRRARLEREISTGKTNNGGVIASLRPSAIEKRKQELDAMGERGRILDAQGKAPRATAEQLTGAQERWQRMTTAERQAVAARTDVKPILRKNLHGAKWENLNVDVQRKLQAAMEPIEAQPSDLKAFKPETGTLGVPRSEMPQVPSQSHGGLVKHLNSQGISHETTTVDAGSLKPTQAEYSPAKVEAAKGAEGGRAVIVSKDGHIIDGHHQAMAAAEEGKTVKAIVLDAPVERALEAVKNSPSAQAQPTEPAAQAKPAQAVNPRVPPENRALEIRSASEKEPWQMTALEFSQQEKGNPHWNQSYEGKDDGAYLADTAATHRRLVQEAIAAAPQKVADDFIPAPDGGLDYGEITPEMGKAMRRQAGKIRLQQGDASFGLQHIELRHGDEIRKAGFESIEAFVSGAVADIESIWKPEATSQLVVIQATERGKVVFIQLQAGKDDDGDFYTVKTAFPSSRMYAEKRKEWKQLWSRVPVPAADTGKSAPSAEPGNEAGSKSTMESGQSDAVSVPPTPETPQPITRADVAAAQQQAAAIITERIDAMTAGEVNTIARRFLPTMGVRPTVSKERNKAAVVDFTKVNPLAAADEFGATLPTDVRRVLQADMEGRVVEAVQAQEEGAVPAQAPQESGRNAFTLERLNRETGEMEPVTFVRGEYVRYTVGGKDQFGDIDGISQARREFSVDGLWYPFGFAYKAERPAAPKADTVPLSSVIDKVNAKNGQGLTDADRVPGATDIGWDSMSQEQRTQILTAPSGWSTAKGGLNVIGKNIAKRAWADIAPATRATIERLAQKLETTDAAPASKTPMVDRHNATMAAVRDGKATAEEFRTSFDQVVGGKVAIVAELDTMTKAQLLREGGAFVQMRYANEKKADVVDAVYREMVGEYALGETVTYSMGKGAYEAAVRKMVEATDADKLARYVTERTAAIEENQARRAAKAAAIENPQTLADFREALNAKIRDGMTRKEAFLALTPEQRTQYDTLEAESTREARETRKRTQKTLVRAAGQTTAGEIVATKHTRDGYDLFVVKLADRLGADDYKTVLASAKKMGGWYSAFRGNGAIPGFQFKDKTNAEAFLALAGGDTTAAQEQVAQRRDAFEDDRSQTAVERLRTMADKLEAGAAEAEGQQRKTNTERRARFASAALQAAANSRAKAQTMRNIAQSIEDGEAKFLDAVRTKSQVDMLTGVVNTAKMAELRAKHPRYADQERHKGEPPTAETADFADFPSYSAFRSDLATLGRQMLEVEGTKKLGQQLMKIADDVTDAYLAFAKEHLTDVQMYVIKGGEVSTFGTERAAELAIVKSGFRGKAIPLQIKRGQYTVILSPSEAMNRGIWKGDGDKRITLTADSGRELVEAIGRRGNKQNQLSVPWQFQTAYDRLKALASIGIETPSEFRAALREFISLKAQAVANRTRELELQMVGRKADGLDFFPTSAEVADQMIEAADLTPDMAVLEPSAGMGHLADRIREAGAEPDVIEISSDRRELLEEKGYTTQAVNDFLDLKPREFFTFGDTFRAPDGAEGIMRGASANRVRLVNDAGDMVGAGYYDRADLTGLAHNGTASGYDRIIMNPPFSNRRDAEHVRHAFDLLKPGGRIVAIMGEGVFFGQDKKAQDFREWLEAVGGTSEKLPEGSFMDPSLPVNTGVNARMVVIDKPVGDAVFSTVTQKPAKGLTVQRTQDIADRVTNHLGIGPVAGLQVFGKPGEAGFVVPASVVPQGATRNGKVYLFAANISDEVEAFKVVVHELFHLGLSKSVPQGAYIQTMLGYLTDPQVRQYANRWKETADGVSRKASMPVNNWHALAVEEALADLAEEMHADRQGGGTRLQGWAARMASRMATLAERMGMAGVAGRIRSFTRTEAEQFVQEMLSRSSAEVEPLLRDARFSAATIDPADASDDGAQFARAKMPADGGAGTTVDRAVMSMVREGEEAPDILRMIANTSASRFNRQIARLLIKTGASPDVSMGGDMGSGAGFKFLAKYSRAGHKLEMSEGALYKAEQIFMHEMIHAATLLSLDKPGLHSLQMRRLYEHVKAQGGAAGQYGMKNVGEFVAEVFTNPEFQKALKGMRAPAGSAWQNAWDALVRIIRSIVGLPDNSQDALSAALDIGVNVMRENMRLRTRAEIARGGDAYAGADQTQTEVLRELARAARAAGNANSTVMLGKLSPKEAALLQREGVAVDGNFSHAADMFAVRHALNRHSDAKVERSRGQIAITDDDVARIADAVAAPTAYVLGGKTPRNQDVVGIIKRLEDGTLLYLEEVRDGRKTLAMTSMRKYPGTTDFDTIANSVLPSNARSDTGDVRIVYPDDNDGQEDAYFGAADLGERMGAAIKSVTTTNLKQRAGFKAADYLGLGLQALGRRQIVDIYGDTLPLAEYNKLVAQMEADKNDGGAEADKLVTRWAKLDDEAKLADLMHDATLAQIDPAKPYVEGDDKARHMMLQGRFNALSAEAKQVYTDTRDAYQTHHANVRSAIKERIERSEMKDERKAALLKQMDGEFFKAVKGVYFPLARFGQYAVTVKGPDGKVQSVSRAESKAEAEALRNGLLSAFPAGKGFTVGRVMLSKDFVADRDAVGRGFMTELYQVLDKQDMDAVQRAELEDTLGQLYLSSLPDLSWAKHGIHRKGTPGFSQDARRAFAQNMFHGSRYLAKLRYSDLMQDELAAMQKHVDDWRDVEDFDQPRAQRVVDEMNKRHESLMNPKANALSTALTSFGFVFHLGLSPASAMVNLSQTALVAYPIMGAKWGFGKASAALLKASKEAAQGKNDITGSLNADERAAYDEAVRAGTIDVTMAHDLAGIAQGEDAGVMWKLRPVMKWASFLFHHAERFNRQVTFVAAYRLAREAGANSKVAFEQATKATYDGHFDYGAANRPRVMQGNAAKVLLLFKQYGQNMVYTLARNAQQSLKGETPEVRAQARKALGGLLAMHAAAAGVLGLPMVTTLLAAASMLGGDDDEPWDAQVALQNMLADIFGQKTAEVLAHGLSRLTPGDISGRVGLDRLIFPDVQEGLEGQRLAESAMAAALGPVAGIGVNLLKGAQMMGEGRYALGLEAMLPSALRAPVKAIRYASDGVQDKSGISILDEVSPAAIAAQALGFSPSEARNAQEGKSAVMALDRALNERRQELLSRIARATMEQDDDGKAEAREEIKRFNEKNPGRRINPNHIMASVRNRNQRIEQAQDGVYLPRNRRDAMEAGRFALADAGNGA